MIAFFFYFYFCWYKLYLCSFKVLGDRNLQSSEQINDRKLFTHFRINDLNVNWKNNLTINTKNKK